MFTLGCPSRPCLSPPEASLVVVGVFAGELGVLVWGLLTLHPYGLLSEWFPVRFDTIA